MASVILNDRTVNELEARAAASGMTVDEYLKLSSPKFGELV
jgi:hypothetical protein